MCTPRAANLSANFDIESEIVTPISHDAQRARPNKTDKVCYSALAFEINRSYRKDLFVLIFGFEDGPRKEARPDREEAYVLLLPPTFRYNLNVLRCEETRSSCGGLKERGGNILNVMIEIVPRGFWCLSRIHPDKRGLDREHST